jgi:hypothetical protein
VPSFINLYAHLSLHALINRASGLQYHPEKKKEIFSLVKEFKAKKKSSVSVLPFLNSKSYNSTHTHNHDLKLALVYEALMAL